MQAESVPPPEVAERIGRTPEDVRTAFQREGATLKQWADKNGFEPAQVSKVLNGTNVGRYGKAHQIAVALGLKPGPEAQEGQV